MQQGFYSHTESLQTATVQFPKLTRNQKPNPKVPNHSIM